MSEFGGRKTERDNHYDALTIRDGPTCFYCGAILGDSVGDSMRTLDRWVPKSVGGGAERSNLRMACWACNNAKGSVPGPEFMASDWLAWRRQTRPGASMVEVDVPDGVYTRSYRAVR